MASRMKPADGTARVARSEWEQHRSEWTQAAYPTVQARYGRWRCRARPRPSRRPSHGFHRKVCTSVIPAGKQNRHGVYNRRGGMSISFAPISRGGGRGVNASAGNRLFWRSPPRSLQCPNAPRTLSIPGSGNHTCYETQKARIGRTQYLLGMLYPRLAGETPRTEPSCSYRRAQKNLHLTPPAPMFAPTQV